MAQASGTSIRVWDRFIRLFHWTLVGLVALAALTGFLLGAEYLDVHVWAGTAIAALILARLVWGVLGTAAARFRAFVVSPGAALRHIRVLRDGGHPRYISHNPLGGWMVLALIATLLAITASGAAVLGGVFHAGPLKSLLTVSSGSALRELHEVLAIGLLCLIGLHLGGVIFEGRRHHENLARAMVQGTKPARPGDHLPAPARAHPLAAALIVALGLGGAVLGGSAMSGRSVAQAPVDMAGTRYAALCAECHIAYHPSLLPRASWQQLMTTLDDHFGEDASLPEDAVAELTDWLSAHAAETTDSKPAVRLARVAPERPTEITATPFWIRTHEGIDAAVFAAAPVFGKGNCAACHGDAATGWFYPGQIELP